MNFKLMACIGMGVLAAHMALFMMIWRIRTWNEPPPPVPAAPNFSMAQEVVVDKATGNKIVNREITVSTQLRPDIYKGRPDKPVGE